MNLGTGETLLEIDGAGVPLIAVWVHFQNTPFPGGHRYVLRIPKSQSDAWLARRRLTWDNLRAGFWFQCLFSDLVGGDHSSVPTTHVLNTIDRIEEAEEMVRVCGVCSPFLRAERQ